MAKEHNVDLSALHEIARRATGDTIGASTTSARAKSLVPPGSFISNGKQGTRTSGRSFEARTGGRRTSKRK